MCMYIISLGYNEYCLQKGQNYAAQLKSNYLDAITGCLRFIVKAPTA